MALQNQKPKYYKQKQKKETSVITKNIHIIIDF